jgi:hypothetical protein
MKSKFSKFTQWATLAAIMVLALLPLVGIAAVTTSAGSGLSLSFDIRQGSSSDLGASNFKYSTQWLKTFANGSGIDQASKVYVKTSTLAGSGTLTIDLDSTLTGPLGSVSFTRIYGIFVRRTDTPVASTQDENVTIGGDWILTKYLVPGADTLAAVTLPLRPGALWVYVSPDATGTAVTASTGDEITFTNASSADSTTLNVLILGS